MRVLNVGCGDDMYGTDRVDIRETKATTKICDLESRLPYESGTFDHVYSKNNLEHLRNVGLHLLDLHRVLKRGGTLMIITDNAACLKYYTAGTHMGRYERMHPGDRHYGLFTRKHLLNHLEAAGFSRITSELIDTDYFSRHYDRVVRWWKPELSYPRIKVEAVKC